ncbi:MutS-related protein [Arthrobacter rhombi]|uniref:MutS-related protein n=1 Tax=Arthrobacter rhombi TaxID=71253 RepID=UPI003FD43C99
MRVFLMHREQDFDPGAAAEAHADDLIRDLELATLIDEMAGEDQLVQAVARTALLCPQTNPVDITYRQAILRDAFQHPETVRGLYDLAGTALERAHQARGWMTARNPVAALQQALGILRILVPVLQELRTTASQLGPAFDSEGFSRFFGMVLEELGADFFPTVKQQLTHLEFPGGVSMSARLDPRGKSTELLLQKPVEPRKFLGHRLETRHASAPSFRISDRDETGAKELGDLRGRAISPVAAAMSRSTNHILDFFRNLRTELAFYMGCLRLQETLAGRGVATCFPVATSGTAHQLECTGLYDVSLALLSTAAVVGNDISARDIGLIMITGANRGGKSTLLRSLGMAQLMMQCGMFVGADSLTANVAAGVFTHFKREEDTGQAQGKLDEELARMDGIVDRLSPSALMLFNESFGATNEREGSEIGRQVVRALLKAGIKVVFVTHMYDLAGVMAEQNDESMLFLRADRGSTFKVVEGAPLPSSYGADLYRRVFTTTEEGSEPLGG